MKVFDGRLRPPYRSIAKETRFFERNFVKDFNANYGFAGAPSDWEKSMDLLMQEMKEAGVVKALTPYRNIQGAGMNNDDFAFLNEEYPDTFYGMVGLNPLKGMDATLAEIDKYVTNGAFTGVNMEPWLDPIPWDVNNESYFPIFEKCEKENIPIYITWGGLVAPPKAYNPQTIYETVTAFPKAKFYLGHAGFPYSAAHCCLAINCPNVWLGVDLYVINAPGQQDFITSANYRLHKQICFGSAYPYADLREVVAYYDNMGLREEIKEDVFYNNNARFVGLE